MPIPKPNKNESKKEFINRCMVDDTMVAEYDEKQRYAICESQLDKNNNINKKKDSDMATNEKRHVKEIIEDDETITIIYEKDENFEGIKIKDSDIPDEGEEETIEEKDAHEDEDIDVDVDEDEDDEDVDVDVDIDEDEDEDRDEHYDEEEEDLEEDIEEDEDDVESIEEDEIDDEEELEDVEDEEIEEDIEKDEEVIDEEEDEYADEEEDDEDEDEEEEKSRKKKKRSVWDKKDSTEKRFFNIETRVKKKGKRNIIEGHAAVFGKLSEDLGGFREIISRKAFDNVLDNNVRIFFNHDPNYLLATTGSNTAKVSVDKKGLRYSFEVPETTAGRDLLVSMKRGDITQSSFAFSVEKDSWSEKNGTEIRTIEKVARLFDCSPVSIPAYPDANDLAIAQRSRMIYKDKTKLQNENDYEYKRSLLGLKINIIKRK